MRCYIKVHVLVNYFSFVINSEYKFWRKEHVHGTTSYFEEVRPL